MLPKFVIYAEMDGDVHMRVAGEGITRKFLDLLEAISTARRLSDGKSQLVAYSPTGSVVFEAVV